MSESPTTSSISLPDFALWEKMHAKRSAFSFDLEVTARCNNACRHCYIALPAGDQAAKAQELSIAEIKDITRQAIDLGALWCLVTGGEPLLREDFPELFMTLKRQGLLLSVFTNACLVTKEHVALFKKYPPRDIEISVYGVTEETYERVTQKPGSFAAFMRGLEMLMDSGVKIRLKAMALRSNVHELPQIAAFCRKYTKDYFRFDPLLHLRFDRDLTKNALIKAERLSPQEIVAIERADEERFNSLEKGCDRLIVEEFAHMGCNHLFHCGAGNGSFAVSYDGKFRLCSSLWQPDCLYDLRKGKLADAWRDFIPKVRDMRSNRKEFLETCRRCPIINLCLWCPAHAYLEEGEMDAVVPYFCEVAHARAAAIQGAK